MNVQELIDITGLEIITKSEDLGTEITKPFCCDLLSIAMGKAPSGSAWVTVMGNINTLAVASLADVACIILAEGANLDDVAKTKSEKEGITVLRTRDPIFEAALKIHNLINAD